MLWLHINRLNYFLILKIIAYGFTSLNAPFFAFFKQKVGYFDFLSFKKGAFKDETTNRLFERE